MNFRILVGVIVVGLVIYLAGCAAGPNTVAHIAAPDGNIAGFWLGLWHGWILPITFIISLFSDNINFYEIHNNGGWYNFGFVVGTGILFGSSCTWTIRIGDND